MFDLTRNIYFLPVTETNLQILNLSNKIIDGIIGGLEKESDARIDTKDNIKLYNQTFKILNKSTGHLIRLLRNEDDKTDKMKEFKEAMTDPFQNIRDYITERVSFLIVFLTYHWNKISCNLPSAYLSNNMKYRSLMSPLSKLNAIEMCEAGWGNSEATVHYGLYCACCKQFIANSDGFTSSISKLVDLLQIAVDVHFGAFCTLREKLWKKGQLFISTNLHLYMF